MSKDGYVFGLDIGTRSIVGTVGYRVGTDRFVVVAQVAVEHTTRAVIDGQIHDIPTVARTIAQVKTKLEEKIGGALRQVSIAAAGRVLKTKNVYVEYEMPSEAKVSQEHIHSLDSLAVEMMPQGKIRSATREHGHFRLFTGKVLSQWISYGDDRRAHGVLHRCGNDRHFSSR